MNCKLNDEIKCFLGRLIGEIAPKSLRKIQYFNGIEKTRKRPLKRPKPNINQHFAQPRQVRHAFGLVMLF